MIGGGEFIINGAERVVVSQLHRSPGVDFVVEIEAGDRKLHACRVIPERGSWIELQRHQERHARRPHRPVRQVLGDDPAPRDEPAVLVRRRDPRRRSTKPRRSITSDPKAAAQLEGEIACGDVVDPTTGEVLIESGTTISKTSAQVLADADIGLDPGAQGSARTRSSSSRSRKIRPPTTKAPCCGSTSASGRATRRSWRRPSELFHEKFFDTNRYRLGKVGRFRINRKFNQNVPDDQMTLRPRRLRQRDPLHPQPAQRQGHVDDIDHLGNRRLRTIDELAADELRKGFLKLRRTVQERMSLKDAEDMTPRSLINPKSISAAIEYFFGRGELSQVVDQTNPLAQLTHERRLSALGPGGLNRKRAGFEVRDVHISHYGRICPIETPEGTNIGLISSLGIYAGVDEYGFLVTPYREIKNGQPHREGRLDAGRRGKRSLPRPGRRRHATTPASSRARWSSPAYQTDFHTIPIEQVQYMDISPKQMVGVSAGLIPFLEHDDANRA